MDLAVLPAPRGCLTAPAGLVTTLHGRTMGTIWTVKIGGLCPAPAGVRSAIVARLGGLVAQLSHWERESEISRYNRAAAGTRVTIGEDFAAVMTCALSVAELSGGAFDPALGRAADAWGFGPRLDAIAPQGRGWRDLVLEGDTLLQPGGVQLDLSGVAKGYAVDAVTALLEERGLTSCLVEIGGEMFGTGLKPDGQPWWAQIEPPGEPMRTRIMVALPGWGLATSGDYRRFHDHAGLRLSHTLDPVTGAPVAGELASVTVLAGDCMSADAWATALTVLGEEDGPALADVHGLAALFLLRGGDGEFASRTSAAWNELWA